MPGPWVKDWKTYEALKEKGMSKEQAAKIANSQAAKAKGKGKKKGALRFKGKAKRKGMRFRADSANGDSALTA